MAQLGLSTVAQRARMLLLRRRLRAQMGMETADVVFERRVSDLRAFVKYGNVGWDGVEPCHWADVAAMVGPEQQAAKCICVHDVSCGDEDAMEVEEPANVVTNAVMTSVMQTVFHQMKGFKYLRWVNLQAIDTSAYLMMVPLLKERPVEDFQIVTCNLGCVTEPDELQPFVDACAASVLRLLDFDTTELGCFVSPPPLLCFVAIAPLSHPLCRRPRSCQGSRGTF